MDDQVDIQEVIDAFWSGKWVVLFATIFFALGGVIISLSMPNIYQASVVLAPANSTQSDGVSSQFGSLASLAGVSVSRGTVDKVALAKEVLQSRKFLSEFIHRHKIQASIVAVQSWNFSENRWEYDPERYNVMTDEWVKGEDGVSSEPSDWELVGKFRPMLTVSDEKDTGVFSVSIKSQSPIMAKEWLDSLINDLNEYVREKDKSDAEARILFLKKELGQTNVAGLKQVFYELIEAETRTVMLANAEPEYVFKIIDPAVVPQEKISPRRAFLCLVALIAGFLVGLVLVLVRRSLINR